MNEDELIKLFKNSFCFKTHCKDVAVGTSVPSCFREMDISVFGGASPKTPLPPTECSVIKPLLITACLYRAYKTSAERKHLFHLKTHVWGEHINFMAFHRYLL